MLLNNGKTVSGQYNCVQIHLIISNTRLLSWKFSPPYLGGASQKYQ